MLLAVGRVLPVVEATRVLCCRCCCSRVGSTPVSQAAMRAAWLAGVNGVAVWGLSRFSWSKLPRQSVAERSLRAQACTLLATPRIRSYQNLEIARLLRCGLSIPDRTIPYAAPPPTLFPLSPLFLGSVLVADSVAI